MQHAIMEVQRALSGDFDVQACFSVESLLLRLAALINELIHKDFNRLVSILYRLDVSETKLQQTLHEHAQQDAGMLIAGLIVERQLQKLKSRAKFRPPDTDIPEEDRW
jgi:hypothetical protein